jgi:multiple sugar transport system ATP-binding protein
MNFLEGRVEDGTLVGEAIEYPLPAEAGLSSAEADGRALTLGIRPEDLEVDSEADDGHVVAGTVTVVESLGNERNLHVEIADVPDTDLVVTVDNQSGVFRSGDRVAVHVPPDRIHLFDASTGDAIHNKGLTPAQEPAAQQ